MEPHTLLTIPGAVPFKCRYMNRVVFDAAGKKRFGAAAVATHKSFLGYDYVLMRMMTRKRAQTEFFVGGDFGGTKKTGLMMVSWV